MQSSRKFVTSRTFVTSLAGVLIHWAKAEMDEYDASTQQMLKNNVKTNCDVGNYEAWRRKMDPLGVLSKSHTLQPLVLN